MTERRGRRCKQLLGEFKVTREYWHLEQEVLEATLWRTRFGRSLWPCREIKYSINN